MTERTGRCDAKRRENEVARCHLPARRGRGEAIGRTVGFIGIRCSAQERRHLLDPSENRIVVVGGESPDVLLPFTD